MIFTLKFNIDLRCKELEDFLNLRGDVLDEFYDEISISQDFSDMTFGIGELENKSNDVLKSMVLNKILDTYKRLRGENRCRSHIL